MDSFAANERYQWVLSYKIVSSHLERLFTEALKARNENLHFSCYRCLSKNSENEKNYGCNEHR